MKMIDSLKIEFEHEARTTRRHLERLPGGKLDWRPHEKSFTSRDLASHIVDCVSWADSIFNLDELDVDPAVHTAYPEGSERSTVDAPKARRSRMKSPGALTITTPTDREVVLTRVFDAAPHLVFDALTRPELLERWYGPNGWSLVVCEIDLKVGGRWRFVVRRPDGKNIGQRGVYREIVPAERLVNTESWEDWDPGETLVTTVLVDQGGKTTLTSTLLFPSQKVRDTVLKSGLEPGAVENYDKLAGLLATLPRGRSQNGA